MRRACVCLLQDGVTATMCAARLGRTDMAAHLVRLGAHIDAKDKVCPPEHARAPTSVAR
jgi:hypothetical protein